MTSFKHVNCFTNILILYVRGREGESWRWRYPTAFWFINLASCCPLSSSLQLLDCPRLWSFIFLHIYLQEQQHFTTTKPIATYSGKNWLARICSARRFKIRERDRQGLKMITVAIMAELLEEYAVALARITERLMPPRRIINGFRRLRNSRLPSSSAATHDQDPCSFIVYFWFMPTYLSCSSSFVHVLSLILFFFFVRSIWFY